MPATSTSVATKGAEALAGSKRSARRTSGSTAPVRVPIMTTPTRLKATVKATAVECSP